MRRTRLISLAVLGRFFLFALLKPELVEGCLKLDVPLSARPKRSLGQGALGFSASFGERDDGIAAERDAFASGAAHEDERLCTAGADAHAEAADAVIEVGALLALGRKIAHN